MNHTDRVSFFLKWNAFLPGSFVLNSDQTSFLVLKTVVRALIIPKVHSGSVLVPFVKCVLPGTQKVCILDVTRQK